MAENELAIVRNGHGSLEDGIIEGAYQDLEKGLSETARKILQDADSINPNFSGQVFNRFLSGPDLDKKSFGELCRICPEPPIPQTFEGRRTRLTEMLREQDSLNRRRTLEPIKAVPVFKFL